jgi:hypothetical protein
VTAVEKAKSKSQKVRETLTHPVIDSDGHTVECEVVFLEYLEAIGGSRIVDRYRNSDTLGSFVDTRGDGWYHLSPASTLQCSTRALV